MADGEEKEVRLLIIGKTGNGKSTLGNIILGSNHFQTGCSMSSATVKPATGIAVIDGQQIKVVDTPDISNMDLADSDDAQREVATWKALTSPDPTAILLAVRCDVRYTREEYDIYLQLKRLWGGGHLASRLIVAFTFGDRQDQDLDSELRCVCAELQGVLKDASSRYVSFTDRTTDEAKRQQVHKLLDVARRADVEETQAATKRLLSRVQVCPMGPVNTTNWYTHPPSPTTRGPAPQSTVLKLLLVGKPGSGKSSTGNTILGRDAFPVHPIVQRMQANDLTRMEEVVVNGRQVQVIDTPGLQIGLSQDPMVAYRREQKRAYELSLPGPHALLYVVRHQKVIREDLEGFQLLQKQLGQGLSHHTVVVLVGAEANGDSRQNNSDAEQKKSLIRQTSNPQSPKKTTCPPSPLTAPSSPAGLIPQGKSVRFQRSRSLTEAASDRKMARLDLDEGFFFDELLREAGSKLWVVNNISRTSTSSDNGSNDNNNASATAVDMTTAAETQQEQVQTLLGVVDGILENSGGRCFQGGDLAEGKGKGGGGATASKKRDSREDKAKGQNDLWCSIL